MHFYPKLFIGLVCIAKRGVKKKDSVFIFDTRGIARTHKTKTTTKTKTKTRGFSLTLTTVMSG